MLTPLVPFKRETTTYVSVFLTLFCSTYLYGHVCMWILWNAFMWQSMYYSAFLERWIGVCVCVCM